MESSLIETIRRHALSLGFSAMGVAPSHTLKQDEVALKRWLDLGYHGDMAYMARAPYRRTRPLEVLPGAQSVIVLATNYYPGDPPEKPIASITARVSRYAWGRDYHLVIEERLKQLEGFIKLQEGPDVKCRSYVDYGPILEKSVARDAGLGFIGKNTLLITESFGSWVFLSVILTTLVLTPGQPQTSQCGSCRLCLEACPTDALTDPFVLDARKCISYLTIENKNEIPDHLKSRIGNWIFGCDICQEVCPYNTQPKITQLDKFHADQGAGPALDPEKILAYKNDESFKMHFRETPLLRPKRSGIQRNAKVVLRNDQQASVKGEQV
jgi:epoxyqueuosine reductase